MFHSNSFEGARFLPPKDILFFVKSGNLPPNLEEGDCLIIDFFLNFLYFKGEFLNLEVNFLSWEFFMP